MLDLSTATDEELQILLLGLRRLRYWHMCKVNGLLLVKLNGDIKAELGNRYMIRDINRVIYNEE